MILYLVRHGETAHNRDGLGLGREDVALTALGELQAAAVARRLAGEPIVRILTSPLQRAGAVARAIGAARGVEVEVADELLELDVGETEGMTFPAMRETYAGFLKEWGGPDGHAVRMPGGESLVDLERRAGTLVDRLIAGGDGPAVALVTHNFVLRVLICRLLGVGASGFRSLTVDLASVSAVQVEGARVSVLYINDTCHLDGIDGECAPS
ncbi:MAG: histidine phosphatase family protein [Tepidiformaceae bacterium]